MQSWITNWGNSPRLANGQLCLARLSFDMTHPDRKVNDAPV